MVRFRESVIAGEKTLAGDPGKQVGSRILADFIPRI